MAPFPDEGLLTDVSQARSDIAAALEANIAIGAAPDGTVRFADVVDDSAWAARRADLVARAWGEEVRVATLDEWEHAILEAAQDESYRFYTDSRLVVERWQGIRIEGSRSFALFIAHPRYLVAGSWEGGDGLQYQVDAIEEDGVWKLLTDWAVDADGNQG